MPDPKAVVSDWHFWGSSASMFNGAYFKIKQLQLGYTIPTEITKKAHQQAKALRIARRLLHLYSIQGLT